MEWSERARRAAVILTRDGADDADTARTMFLADLRDMFAAERNGVLFSAEIVERLQARDDRPWPEYRRGKAITAPQIAQILRPLKILSGTVRRGGATAKGYRADQCADAFARYLTPPPVCAVTPSQTAESAPIEPSSAVTRGTDVTAAKRPETAETADCDIVTSRDPLRWRERI